MDLVTIVVVLAIAAVFVPWLAKRVRLAQHQADLELLRVAEEVRIEEASQKMARDLNKLIAYQEQIAETMGFVDTSSVDEHEDGPPPSRPKPALPNGMWVCFRCNAINDGDPRGRCSACDRWQ